MRYLSPILPITKPLTNWRDPGSFSNRFYSKGRRIAELVYNIRNLPVLWCAAVGPGAAHWTGTKPGAAGSPSSSGNGTLKTSGLGSNSAAKEAIKVGFDYFKANASRVSASIKAGDHDYHLHVVELHNTGPTTAMTLAAFVALCSGVFADPAADGGPGQHEPGRKHRAG